MSNTKRIVIVVALLAVIVLASAVAPVFSTNSTAGDAPEGFVSIQAEQGRTFGPSCPSPADSGCDGG